MKNILIIGKGSYVGESFKKWLEKFANEYHTEIVSSLNHKWQAIDFSKFDTVVDFAGIAHINKIKEDMKGLFYSVNRDLTGELGRQAKEQGIKHFIYFSSMNVYGDYCNCVKDRNAENPTGFYGDSKLMGDKELEKLEDESFIVAHIRPPFVYGRNCTGNYNTISKIAKRTPVFPTYRNRKSMIYIDNLCEFVRFVVDKQCGGIFTPQNKELVSTADLVREIASNAGHKIWFTSVLNWAIGPAVKFTRAARRAFADDCYAMELSDYWDYRYCVVDFKESIRRTENNQ